MRVAITPDSAGPAAGLTTAPIAASIFRHDPKYAADAPAIKLGRESIAHPL